MARLFVCDPACAQEIGHNVSSLTYFRDACSGGNYDSVITFCSTRLPNSIASDRGFVGAYGFYYPGFMQVGPASGGATLDDAADGRRFTDRIEGLATADAKRILATWRITRADAFLFPSADFYGVIGLLNALETWPQSEQPAVYLRFIAVMEQASHARRDPAAFLMLRLREAIRRGARVSVAAETPRYADHVALILRAPVYAVPYPPVAEALPLPRSRPFTIFCPGWARADKGYFELLGVIGEVRRRDEALTIRFVTHTPLDRDAVDCEHYTSQLAAVPGVELRPAISSDSQLREDYRRCHAVLLPYDIKVYAMRGSAVMMEAACLGRPVLTLAGAGFADQVRYYGLGHVLDSVAQLPAALLALAREPLPDLEFAAFQGRRRFLTDATAAQAAWLGSAP